MWAAGPQERWCVQAIESIHKQPKLVLGHINSQAISKCWALPALVRATVPLAGSEAEAIRRVTLVQQVGAQADAV